LSETIPPGGGTTPPPSPKDPILVLVLNLLLCGGAGYIAIGQKAKGIAAIVLWAILFYVTCGAASGLVAIFGAVDGYLQAQQLQEGRRIGEWTFFRSHSAGSTSPPRPQDSSSRTTPS